VLLTHGEKRQGVICHVSAVVGWRRGASGNLITESTWAAFEKDRKPDYKPEFKNPFLVWARAGGDYGYWTGKEVSEQFWHLQEFYKWERGQPDFIEALSQLDHPIKERITNIHTDRSQMHLMAKPDGTVLAREV
jgi:hypothetical protein